MSAPRIADQHRNDKLSKIHLAKKWAEAAGFFQADDDYRDFLQKHGKRRSAGDMAASQMEEVLRAFKNMGWKAVRRKATNKVGGLIRALWKDKSREKTEAALLVFIRHRLDLPENVIKDPDHLTHAEAQNIIGALRGFRPETMETKP